MINSVFMRFCVCVSLGALLDLLDKYEIAENTVIFYTSDNGPHQGK